MQGNTIQIAVSNMELRSNLAKAETIVEAMQNDNFARYSGGWNGLSTTRRILIITIFDGCSLGV